MNNVDTEAYDTRFKATIADARMPLAVTQPIGRRALMMAKKPKKTDNNGWTAADDTQLYKWKGACSPPLSGPRTSAILRAT